MNWRARSRLKCPKDNLMTSSHPQSRPPQPSASPEQRGWSYRWAVAGLQAERRAGTRTEILLLSCLAPSKHPTSLLPHLISQLPYGQPVFKSLPVLPQLPPPHTDTQQKLPRGLPPAAHQGELFRTASLRDPTDETPNTSTFCLSFFSPSIIFISLFLPPHKWMCALEWVAGDWRARVGAERGGAMIRIPQDWVEENSAGLLAQRFFFSLETW